MGCHCDGDPEIKMVEPFLTDFMGLFANLSIR